MIFTKHNFNETKSQPKSSEAKQMFNTGSTFPFFLITSRIKIVYSNKCSAFNFGLSQMSSF